MNYIGRPIDLDRRPPHIPPKLKEEPYRVGQSLVRSIPPYGVAVYSHQIPQDPVSLQEIAEFEAAVSSSASSSVSSSLNYQPEDFAGDNSGDQQAFPSLASHCETCDSSPEVPSTSSAGASGRGETAPANREVADSVEVVPRPQFTFKPPVAYFLPRTAGEVHPGAVQVGKDEDGGPLFVGRAVVCGQLLPGKVAPLHRCCYIAQEDKEIACSAYEVLVLENARAKWVTCGNGKRPANAFPVGRTLHGEKIFSVRARCRRSLTPGMLLPNEKKCSIPFDTRVYRLEEYEVLTIVPSVTPIVPDPPKKGKCLGKRVPRPGKCF